MKLYMAEMEAFDELAGAQTLADVVRIGFNRVDFTNKDGKRYECWEMSGDNEVIGNTYGSDQEGADEFGVKQTRLDGNTPIDQMSVCIDRDEDQYTIVSVEEMGD